MSTSEATIKALKELGLTEYETAAYLALVAGGQISASDISSRSKVPYSRIYDVLGRLEEKAFIQVQRGRPTIYIAKAPTEVARLVRMAWEDKIETASSIVVNELQPRFEREVQASSRDVWLMHGRAAILAKALEMLESARDEVKLSVPSLDMGMEDLTAIIERVLHVKASIVQVLTSRGAESLGLPIPSQVEIRTRDRVFGAGLIVDEQQTLIMLSGSEGNESFLGIYSSHVVFAAMARAYFDSLWSEATPI
ncbi:MAG: helix-turn-helix domain-containing protein [Candidatus Bathyarchaeia archaeon]